MYNIRSYIQARKSCDLLIPFMEVSLTIFLGLWNMIYLILWNMTLIKRVKDISLSSSSYHILIYSRTVDYKKAD